jgi:hypothetical protein
MTHPLGEAAEDAQAHVVGMRQRLPVNPFDRLFQVAVDGAGQDFDLNLRFRRVGR